LSFRTVTFSQSLHLFSFHALCWKWQWSLRGPLGRD